MRRFPSSRGGRRSSGRWWGRSPFAPLDLEVVQWYRIVWLLGFCDRFVLISTVSGSLMSNLLLNVFHAYTIIRTKWHSSLETWSVWCSLRSNYVILSSTITDCHCRHLPIYFVMQAFWWRLQVMSGPFTLPLLDLHFRGSTETISIWYWLLATQSIIFTGCINH